MSKKRSSSPVTREEIERRLEVLSETIDFDALIKAGILEKRGRKYKILSLDQLPENAKGNLKTIEQTKDGVLVTFYSPKKKKR